MASTIENMIVKLGADTGDFASKMGFAEKTLGGIGSMAKTAAVGVGVLASAVTGAAVASATMAAGFQADMKNVETLLGAGMGDRIKELGEDVKKLSTQTGKPLNDLAGGLYQVVSAFGDSGESAQLLEISAKASTAGLASTEDAVNLLSSVTKGYGDTSAKAVQKVSDLAFQTVKLGQTTFPELAASMGKAVPLAATLGVNVESLFGSMATLTGVTGNTAEVATQMRATLQALINPSKDMQVMLEQLGFTSGKAAVESLGFQGVLTKLNEATGGNTQQLAKMFGSVEALNSVLALTGAQAGTFAEKTEAMSKANGASAEAFEIQQQSVNAMMDRLKQMATVAAVSLGERFLPWLEKAGQWVMDHMPEIEAAFDSAFTLIDKGFSMIGDGINWFLANIWQPLISGWTSGNDDITGTMGKTGQFLKESFDLLAEIGGKWVEVFTLFWNEWGDEIMAIAEVVWNTIMDVITAALKIISGVYDTFIGLFTGDWQRMSDGLLVIWNGLWDGIKAIVSGVWEMLKIAFGGLFDSIKKWFADLISDAIGWGRDMMQGFLNGITGMFGVIADKVRNFVSGMVDSVKSVLNINSPSGVFEDIGTNIGKGLVVGIEGTDELVSRALVATVDPSAMPLSVSAPVARGRGGSMTIVLQLDGRTLARQVIPFIPGELVRLGVR